NIGWFTVLASTLVGPSGRVTAFEPRPETRLYLEQTVMENKLANSVQVLPFALADRPGTVYLTWGLGTDNPGGSHIAYTMDDRDRDGADVEVKRLDDFDISKCDFIKIDIEGAEHKAFLGGTHLLRSTRPFILSELHAPQLRRVSDASADDYLELMMSLGFDCFLITPSGVLTEVRTISADLAESVLNVIFAPQEKRELLQSRVGAAWI
ncbi:MAG: FkbM family methyltransferase, partial [Caulobacteraceae bacterium]